MTLHYRFLSALRAAGPGWHTLEELRQSDKYLPELDTILNSVPKTYFDINYCEKPHTLNLSPEGLMWLEEYEEQKQESRQSIKWSKIAALTAIISLLITAISCAKQAGLL